MSGMVRIGIGILKLKLLELRDIRQGSSEKSGWLQLCWLDAAMPSEQAR